MRPEALLARAGIVAEGAPVPLSGGDMGEVHRVGDLVVKSHTRPPAGLFPAEARGLARLAEAGVRVPAVRWAGEEGLVIEWLASGPDDWGGLAEQVARLHRSPGPAYGVDEPVFLGRFPLPAATGTDWRGFFREHRLEPLIRATEGRLGGVARELRRALERYEPPTEGPVLLHGDLWSGNVHMSSRGAALIDPSCWYGERAVDLAMMELFGGFPSAFWEAYEALMPIPDEVRRGLPYHQLYFLLVHVHFFGGGYVDGVRRSIRALGAS